MVWRPDQFPTVAVPISPVPQTEKENHTDTCGGFVLNKENRRETGS